MPKDTDTKAKANEKPDGAAPEAARVIFPEPGRPHTEAAHLAFTSVWYGDVEWHLTLREGVTGEAVVEFLENLAKVTDWAGKQEGWSILRPVKVASPKKPATYPAKKEATPPKKAAALRPVAAATSSPDTADVENIIPVQLVSSHVTDNGKEYFRVKGGRCMKHGIRCWPEVAKTMAAFGLEVADMTLGKEYDVADFGLIAHFIYNDKGQISKIVQFTKGD